jgi:hypothetical protein
VEKRQHQRIVILIPAPNPKTSFSPDNAPLPQNPVFFPKSLLPP